MWLNIFVLLALSISPSFSYSELEKCDFAESIEVIGCVSPVLDIVTRLDDIGNMTRARAFRINEECKNTSRCLSAIKCTSDQKLDKTMDVLCDAFSYFSTDFFECQKNITRQNPQCIRKIGSQSQQMLSMQTEPEKFCKFTMKASKCFKEEITDICGEQYWTPINTYFSKLSKLGNLPCKLNSV